jgi:hypothetical protein
LVLEFRERVVSAGPVRLTIREVDSPDRYRRLYFTVGRVCLPPKGLAKRSLRLSKLDEATISLLVEFRKRAILLNRTMGVHRNRVGRVKRLLSWADAPLPFCRRRLQHVMEVRARPVDARGSIETCP